MPGCHPSGPWLRVPRLRSTRTRRSSGEAAPPGLSVDGCMVTLEAAAARASRAAARRRSPRLASTRRATREMCGLDGGPAQRLGAGLRQRAGARALARLLDLRRQPDVADQLARRREPAMSPISVAMVRPAGARSRGSSRAAPRGRPRAQVGPARAPAASTLVDRTIARATATTRLARARTATTRARSVSVSRAASLRETSSVCGSRPPLRSEVSCRMPAPDSHRPSTASTSAPTGTTSHQRIGGGGLQGQRRATGNQAQPSETM